MNWIEEIGDLSFQFSDRDIFEHEDPAIRVHALQKYFFPQLGRLLRGATSLTREIYGQDVTDGLTRAERPRPKGGGYAVTWFDDVHLGLTGERQTGGLKFKKPDGGALQYGASALWFQVQRHGTIQVVFHPLLYGVDATAKKVVSKVFEESRDYLGVMCTNHFVTNIVSLNLGTLAEFVRKPSPLFSVGLYFPLGPETGVRRLAVTFAALFPWFRAITDLSLGGKPHLEKDIGAYCDWWERTGVPYLVPEVVKGIRPPISPATSGEPGPTQRDAQLPILRDRRRWRILERDGWRCVGCGRTPLDGVQLEIDHKTPRSQGGGSEDSNLQVLCSGCNRGKSDTGSDDLTRPGRPAS